MARRPKAERESTSKGTTSAVHAQPVTASGELVASDAEVPDLDDRERRQAPERKPPGPKRPSSPAPKAQRRVRSRGGGATADDEPIESWGRDPVVMPPADPEPS